MQYDLFISYASADRPWAEKLYNELTALAPQLAIFFDRQSLRAGGSWENQLNDAVRNSRHFAVLWSDKAAPAESWVGPEIQTFDAAARSAPEGERTLFYIPLQGKRPNLESRQGFVDLRELEVYGKEDSELDEAKRQKKAAAWTRIVNGIIDGVTADPNTDVVPVALFTISRTDFDRIPRSDNDVAMDLDALLNKLETLSYSDLQQRYQADARSWCPFGGQASITDLLDTVRTTINTALTGAAQRPIRWDYIEFEGLRAGVDEDKIRQILAELNSRFSILVIDPVALYNRRIQRIFLSFGQCLVNDRTVTITLSPVINPVPFHVSFSVRDLARPILDAYFDPPVPSATRELSIASAKRYTNLGMNVDREIDIRRLIMSALVYNRSLGNAPDAGNAFTATRGAERR